jgi:hypothetical protein
LGAQIEKQGRSVHSGTALIASVIANASALGLAIKFLNHISPWMVVVDTML